MKNILRDFIEWLTTPDQKHPQMEFQGGMFYKIIVVLVAIILFLGIIKTLIT
jgi:hypothetical protein